MSKEIRNGDWVTVHPFSHRGTAENVQRHILAIRLDPGHGHFRDTIYSSPDEVVLVRDMAIEDAKRDIQLEQQRVTRIDANIVFQQSERAKAKAALGRARNALIAARKIPRLRPADNGAADAFLAAAGLLVADEWGGED
jgi:hypothetical protein